MIQFAHGTSYKYPSLEKNRPGDVETVVFVILCCNKVKKGKGGKGHDDVDDSVSDSDYGNGTCYILYPHIVLLDLRKELEEHQ